MIIPVYNIKKTAYVAGMADGIVTVNGVPSSCKIYVLDAITLNWLQTAKSLSNGHYMIGDLDPSKQYLVMARDYNKEYEPAVFDYVTPATDLTIAQQQELWQSWQTSP